MAITGTVDPWVIHLIGALPARREVRHQMRRLDTEGQIEPLVAVYHEGTWYVDNSDYPYANSMVWAARLLRCGVDPEADFSLTFMHTNQPGPEWTLMLTNERDSDRS